MITVFDGLGKFTADTSQLDEFTTKLEHGLTGASEKAAAATVALKSAQQDLRDTIKTVTAEGGGTAENMAKLADAEKNLALAAAANRQEHDALRNSLTGAKQATEQFAAEGTKVRGEMYEARDATELLGESIGVRLPRAVGRFVAELPGIGDALNSGFTAFAVIALIDWIIKAGEKLDELTEKPLKIRDAWDTYRDTVIAGGEKIRGEINQQEQKLIEMTQGPIAALDFALRHLQTTAFETFQEMSADVGEAVKAMKEQAGFGNVFGDAAKDLEHFKVALRHAMEIANEEFPHDKFAAYNAGIKAVQDKERELTALIAERTAASGKDASAAVDGLHAERQAVNELLPLLQQGIKLDQERDKIAKTTKLSQIGKEDTEQAKRDLETQLLAIQKWSAGVHDAYLAGKASVSVWLVAQVQASTEATAAQEKYQDRIAQLAKQYGTATQANVAAQTAVINKEKEQEKATDALSAAIAKHNQYAKHMRESWLALEEVGVSKEFEKDIKATEELTKAQGELAKAQQELASGDITAKFSEQEAKIEQLGKNRVISQQEMNARLAVLYKQEEEEALKPLNDLLAAQKRVIAQLQADIAAEKNNPFFTAAQLLQLEKNLAEAQTAMTRTETRISAITQQFENKTTKSLAVGAKSWDEFFAQIVAGSLTAGHAIQALGELTAQGIAASVAAAITGSQGFAAAFEQMAKSAIAALAEHAIVKSLEELAYAFSALANPLTAGLAAGHFIAAAKWAAVGTAAAVAGVAIPSGSSGSSSSSASRSGTPGPAANSPNVNAGAGPSQVVNVTHFADGGIATQPMLGMLAEGGAASEEAIIPLHDRNALDKIAAAFMEPIQRLAHMNPNLSIPASLMFPERGVLPSGGSFSGAVSRQDIQELTKALKRNPEMSHVNVTIEGDLPLLVSKINHGTKTGRLRLHSTSTNKTIKQA